MNLLFIPYGAIIASRRRASRNEGSRYYSNFDKDKKPKEPKKEDPRDLIIILLIAIIILLFIII